MSAAPFYRKNSRFRFIRKNAFKKADPAEKYSAKSALQANYAIDVLLSVVTISS